MSVEEKKTTVIADSTTKREDNCAAASICIGGCTLCLTVVGLFASYVAWLVFTIIGLTEVSDSTIRDDYDGSLLWRYDLVLCIYPIIMHKSLVNQSNDENKSGNFCVNVINYFVNIGLASWGTYELWYRSNDSELTEYLIYTTAYIMVIYQWVICALCTTVFGCLCIKQRSSTK